MKNKIYTSFCCSFFTLLSFFLFSQSHTEEVSIFLKTDPNFSTEGLLDMQVSAAWQWRKTLMLGQRDSNSNRAVEQFRAGFNELNQDAILVYPVGQVFDHVAMQNEHLELTRDTTFFCNLSQFQLVDHAIRFQIPNNGTWWNEEWELLMVNFDDGEGWRTGSSEFFDVYYSDLSSDKHIHFQARYDGKIFHYTTHLKGLNCQSVFPNPDAPFWPVNDVNAPWEISVNTPNGQIKGNAYTLLGDDHIMDRPFIFVEGIDFGNGHYPLQNGTFGWCQFTGGDYSGDYSMMSEAPVFLSALRSRGYDIILLDFNDGAADIRDNAEVLIELIERCKMYKQGSETMVLAGASMGGQVARCALGKMEQQGEDHCVGVYISLDSPHEGANIPLGLQALLSFMSNYNANAESFVTNALTRTASEQLLIYQWLDSEGQVTQPWKRAEYEDYLQSIPFPSKCYSIAIANGNFQGQSLPCNNFLLEENCDASAFIPGNELELRAFSLPGDLTNNENTSTEVVIADLTYTTFDWNGVVPDITQDHQVMLVPQGLPTLDCAPGGYRTSMVQLVEALNESADFTNSCGSISSDQYLAQHCFVPSASAWDVPLSTNNVMDAEEQSPFDLVYAPYAINEAHSALTAANASWLLFHLDAILANQQLSNLSEAEHYNFGTAGDLIFPNWDIENNMLVSIQKQEGLHDGSLPSPVLGSHHLMKTQMGCENGLIHLHGKANLEIGDASGTSTATLVVRGGTTLRIDEKGTCWVFPGSELVIENGGKVIISGAGGLRNLGGSVVLKEGGELIYYQGYCSLEDENARVQLMGGCVRVQQNAQLNWTPIASQTGRIEVYPNEYFDFFLEQGSSMRLSGSYAQDTILKVFPGAHCNQGSYYDSQVVLAEGLVSLEGGASMKWTSDLVLKKLFIFGWPEINQQENFITVKNHVQAYQVTMEYVKWYSTALDVDLFDVNSSGSEDWWMAQGSWYYQSGKMVGHGIQFSDMTGSAVFGNVKMVGEGSAFGVHHTGPTSLIFDECQISDYYTGVFKDEGKLGIRCSELSQLVTGVTVKSGATLMLNQGFGKNEWINNDLHLNFEGAYPPLIEGGGNLFSWTTGGPYATGVVLNTQPNGNTLNWSGNEWLTSSFSGNFNLVSESNVSLQIESLPNMAYQNCQPTEMYGFKSAESNDLTSVLYPNPSFLGQQVLLKGGFPDRILDISGRDVLAQIEVQSQGDQCVLNARSLSPGIYWVVRKDNSMRWLLLP